MSIRLLIVILVYNIITFVYSSDEDILSFETEASNNMIIPVNQTYTQQIHSILFPNYSSIIEMLNLNLPDQAHTNRLLTGDRVLYDVKNPPPGNVLNQTLCGQCHGLATCPVLNGLLIQEVYYPTQNINYGTCKIIDALGVRFSSEIFGQGLTFRDTPQCRDIVMQYLCLFWGSQSSMYVNLCLWKEQTTNPDPLLHQYSPRPPCRSFCIQVRSFVCPV